MIFLGHLGLTTAALKKSEQVFNDAYYKVDYRVVLLGSVLPDIIDKPIYLALHLLGNNTISSKLFGHTLGFSALVIIFGYIYSKINHNKNLFILGICSLIHLILDGMWEIPSTLLYPLYGISFPLRLHIISPHLYLSTLYTWPVLLSFELIGGLILIYYFKLSKKQK